MKFISVLLPFVFFATSLSYSTQIEFCSTLGSLSKVEITPECMSQLELVCRDEELWWQLFDASSKYPISGMSYSHNKDFGNYDECVNIDHKSVSGNIKGKYCGMSIAIANDFKHNIERKTLAKITKKKYTHNRDLPDLKVTEDDTVTRLSLCVPDKCTPQEVGMFFFRSAENVTATYFVESWPCMSKDSNTSFKLNDILFVTFLLVIIILIVLSTGYDYRLQKIGREIQPSAFSAFSVLSNGKKLLHIGEGNSSNQIGCLNGIRFISMMWIIYTHTCFSLRMSPLINYVELQEFIDSWMVEYLQACIVTMDTFFFLSGFLLTLGYLKSQYKLPVKKQILSIPMMILHRYLRLTPAVAVLYFTAITIYRLTGSGPMWDYTANDFQKSCLEHWWSFYLYVQNYVNYDDICLSHTWYLSVDTQLHMLTPLVLIPLAVMMQKDQRKPAYISLYILITISVLVSIGIRFADHSIDNEYLTHERLSSYLVGILFGVIMTDPAFQRFPFSKLVNLIIWFGVLITFVAFVVCQHSVSQADSYILYHSFQILYRPVWTMCLAWMVYSCHRGYGGIVNRFLSLGVFQVGARLSYCMYLLHIFVIYYVVGTMRTPQYWSLYSAFYLFCGNLVVTIMLSTFWSLAFESPIIVLNKFVFSGTEKRPTTVQP